MVSQRWFFVLVLLLVVLPVPLQAQYGYHFGRNKIQYEDFDWHVLKTEHFDIYYYPEMQELAENGAHFAEEVYDELENKFSFSLNHRVPLIFYSSNLHFKQTNVTQGFIPDGVGGFFEFLKGRVVVPANGNIHRFRRVIRHELVHVFTFNKLSRIMRDHRVPTDRFLPLWFTEGLAEYWSGEPDYQHEMIMRDAVFSNYLVPLENMYRIRGSYLMYKEGEAVFRFISEVYGEEKILDLMENFWKERDFRKVMALTLNEDFQVVSDRWDEWLKAKYYPELEESDAATLIADAVAAGGFNAKPVYYQFNDGRRKVYYVGNKTGYSNVYETEVDEHYRPIDKPRVLIPGERNDKFEAFHLFESRLSVSQDGQLAFVTKSGQHDVVHVYDLEADELGHTYSFDGLVAVYSPAWSPDGTKITFSSIDKSGFADLYLYDIESSALSRLTNDAYDDRDPSWSPDGRYIAYSSDRTSVGQGDHYNLFTYHLDSGTIQYVTYGEHHDFAPNWSPDGSQLIFTSARRDEDGKYGGQDIWIADVELTPDPSPEVASVAPVSMPLRPASQREFRRLTRLTSASFDPVWTEDNRIVFTSFENYRFTIRQLDGLDSLMAAPRQRSVVDLSQASGKHWNFARVGLDEGAERIPYRRQYNLDIAQGQVSNNPVWGTTGGAAMAFSDMLGDDYWYVTLYNTSQTQDEFLRSMNVAVSRVQLHRRANIGYGLYRFGGLRYDITDPDAATEFPVFFETIYGGFGAISYPISMFRRVELNTSLNWSDKEVAIRNVQREALLLSNAISLVHDNSLYGMNGPMDGWRAKFTAAYTTDILYSNVNYFTLSADVRHYFRIWNDVTLASWGLVRANEGREARLFFLGGSWDLRGHRLFSIRGQKMWFTSHELRVPLLRAPSLYLPILAPFGVANLRGAAFFDAAHTWNEDYYDSAVSSQRRAQLGTGETLGAVGAGLRVNLFGGFVLRYDVGYRYSNGFRDRDDKLFKQFFFGWDF